MLWEYFDRFLGDPSSFRFTNETGTEESGIQFPCLRTTCDTKCTILYVYTHLKIVWYSFLRMSQKTGTSPAKVGAQVKWFNSKAGYGFLTVTEGEKSGSDVFVHHSQIMVSKEQYRYLVQGEYVQFEWVEAGGKSKTDDHPYQAGNVCGVNGGRLMCETRNDNRPTTLPTQRTGDDGPARERRSTRPRGSSRSEGDSPDHEGWTVQPKRRRASRRYGDSKSDH